MTTETDYLVKGGGAVAMAFVDTLLKETDATVTIVDRRAAPGGHWNDAYSFVRLHQPSACYGVASRKLGHGRVDTTGFNAGLHELASGIEVADYFHQVLRDTFLPTGRVTYHPVSELTDDGDIVSLLSGERTRVTVKRKLVDATLMQTSIPLTHKRKFAVAGGVTCIPPNDLSRIAPGHKRFTVLGVGKTAIDSVLWLLANGAPADAITWVLPRDPWLINRAVAQPGIEFFEQSFGSVATQNEILASAATVEDLCKGMESAGLWLRIDPAVWPTMFHGATVTVLELEHLRQIRNLVRLGHVRSLEPNRMVLERGEVAADPDTLYVDCTARALEGNVNARQPVFTPGRIALQMIRQYQPTFSAAMIAHMEATIPDDADKLKVAHPCPMTDVVEDWIGMMITSMSNQGAWMSDEGLRNWIVGCRLDLFSKTAIQIDREDAERQALMARMRGSAGPAVLNLRRLAGV